MANANQAARTVSRSSFLTRNLMHAAVFFFKKKSSSIALFMLVSSREKCVVSPLKKTEYL